jgi:deazaflavin-dependent oxidoreductase (nitroreductase family)
MDPEIAAALGASQVIDLTTTGRRTGEPRRIEIYLHSLDGRLVISGMPNPGRTRGWIHNVAAKPAVILHLKRTAVADVPGTARVVTDPAERAELLAGVARNWNRTDLDVMMEHSPLIEVSVEGYPA